MQLKSLTLAPRRTYSQAGPDNPYVATISVSYNETHMQIELLPETANKILLLVQHEVARGATQQIEQFVQEALAISTQPTIEHLEK